MIYMFIMQGITDPYNFYESLYGEAAQAVFDPVKIKNAFKLAEDVNFELRFYFKFYNFS